LLPPLELRLVALRLGVHAHTLVAVCGFSPLFAARLWWILRYIGVLDVRVLDGGVRVWTESGGAHRLCFHPCFQGPRIAGWLCSVSEEERGHDDGKRTLVDVRSELEYLVASSGYDYLLLAGRLPRAVWGHQAAGGVDSDYIQPNGRLAPPE
jgi:thiosulfate/3-mercaptopyruvate sulfurtransferase